MTRKLIGCFLFAMLAHGLPAHGAMAVKRTVLSNGLVLLTSEQRALPMVSIEMLIDAGARHESAEQAGLAHLTSKLLTEGTAKRNAQQISETLDFIGAGLDTGCGTDLATISITILKKDLLVGLQLLAEILASTSFPLVEMDRQKQAIIASIKAKEEDPGTLAGEAFAAALFPGSPYGRPVEGTEASVKRLDRARVQDFFRRYYRPNRTIMSVVGDVSEQEISVALNQVFTTWTKGEASKPPVAPALNDKAQVLRVNKDLTQANIVLGHGGVPRSHPDYYGIQVMNYILGGGGFSSRAMESIRNERGLAYSVYSYFGAEKSYGIFQFVMQTKNETAAQAIGLAQDEIRRMRDELVSEVELNDAKDYLVGSFPLRFDTNRKVAAFLGQVEYYGLGLDYPERYGDLIRKVSRADVQRVAREHLFPEKLITVMVGNLQKMKVQ
ncbi:MAG TPA: pitrilysin family protein [Candidatus Limnocylindrales bacterium]|nr:pitrilysin family protein [Candidatus Limnocylindrales bacterium]